jgi:hypothetical protein
MHSLRTATPCSTRPLRQTGTSTVKILVNAKFEVGGISFKEIIGKKARGEIPLESIWMQPNNSQRFVW